MTPEERAFCEEVRSAAMQLVGKAGLIMQDAEPNSRQYERAKALGAGLLGLVSLAAGRVAQADVAAEAETVAAGGYDLAALATAPPSMIED